MLPAVLGRIVPIGIVALAAEPAVFANPFTAAAALRQSFINVTVGIAAGGTSLYPAAEAERARDRVSRHETGRVAAQALKRNGNSFLVFNLGLDIDCTFRRVDIEGNQLSRRQIHDNLLRALVRRFRLFAFAAHRAAAEHAAQRDS